MNVTLTRIAHRKQAQRALRTYRPEATKSAFQRDKEASQDAFEWCLIGVAALFACAFVIGLILP